MAVKKNQRIEGMVPKGQDPPDMGKLSDIPKNETLARSNAGADVAFGGQRVDPNAHVLRSRKGK
jgi:hypothetical protein